MIELRFQDAGGDTNYLLEALAEGSLSATSGGGIFAWANASGARSFLGSVPFEALIQRSTFHLVVGTDSITDTAAVESLRLFRDKWPQLNVEAFVHDKSALFHSKLAWFVAPGEVRLIVGSGNLTMGGLKANWEAFTFARASGRSATELLAQIESWLVKWRPNLVPLDDPRVRNAASSNTGSERSLRGGTRARRAEPSAAEEGSEILIAEIPRAGSRWQQANFDLHSYTTFFGAEVGSQKNILLYHVGLGGSVGNVEVRPSVEVRSRNFRFELSGARGSYPPGGRPIAVFLRLASGEFLYMLLVPGDRWHEEAAAALTARVGPETAGRIRRARLDPESGRAALPDAPLWVVRVPEL